MICMNCNSYADLVNFSWHGMACLQTFAWLFCCYLPARLFRNFTSITDKKQEKIAGNGTTWYKLVDGVTQLCLLYPDRALFQQMTARFISDLDYNTCHSVDNNHVMASDVWRIIFSIHFDVSNATSVCCDSRILATFTADEYSHHGSLLLKS